MSTRPSRFVTMESVEVSRQALEDAVRLSEGDKSYSLWLPDSATDYIQRTILQSGEAYELDMLRDMAGHLSSGDLVIDVGANIGNHSLYLVAVAGCRVVAFEPNSRLADIFNRSVELNSFADRVRVFVRGVGRDVGRACFKTVNESNLGSQSLALGEGDVEVVRLDDQTFSQSVKIIKIDVEGMELDVLMGASELISRDKPMLYVESITEAEWGAIFHHLTDIGYVYMDTFNATPTHLFVHKDTNDVTHAQQSRLFRAVRDSYRSEIKLLETRAALNAANLKYRAVTRQNTDIKRRLEVFEKSRDATVTGMGRPRRTSASLGVGHRVSENLSEDMRRLFAIATQVIGRTVLAMGLRDCELAILLGREGYEVTGIDPDPSCVARAEARLAREPEGVRARVQFSACAWPDVPGPRRFDTVVVHQLLGEVSNPMRVLKQSFESVAPAGRLVFTAHFGVIEGGVQRRVFFPGSLHKMLSAHGYVRSIAVRDGLIYAAAGRRGEAPEEEGTQEVSIEEVLALTEEAAEAGQAALLKRLRENRSSVGTVDIHPPTLR